MTFGERVRLKRKEKGLTQTELAQMLGYKDRSSVARIESGERDVPSPTIIDLADALDTTPSYLMGWEDEKSAPAENGESEKIKDLTPRQERIVKLFDELTEPQQDNIIGRAEMLAEQNEEEYKQEGTG